ncbi:hypothetical protein [Kitasatospora aureofaciens]|nr:hypothetical protein [Kitasatospora aureofaciens]
MDAVFAEQPPESRDKAAMRDIQALRDKHNLTCREVACVAP